ncbi:MAG: TlpA family protein disulfide reductase [Thermomicrobiales bacterium]|nr:TlpA family protein disulfide reductase [Thermomicrobiales bacterium]
MTIATGDQAPAFELPVGESEQTLRLADALESGPVVVAVYKSSCRASKVALPVLQNLRDSYTEARLAVWGIALDSPNITGSFARRFGVDLPLLIDEDGYPTAQAYGVSETPTVFLIANSGDVVWQTVGFDATAMEHLSREVGQLLDVPAVSLSASLADLPDRVPG